MKSISLTEHFFRFSVLFFLLITVVSCKEDEQPVTSQSTAQFSQSNFAFFENEGERTLSITFDKPVAADGQIVLKINTSSPSALTTVPATVHGQMTLPVVQGQAQADFKIIAADNPSLDGCKVVKFSIMTVSDGMLPGSVTELVVAVDDDESPVDADFSQASINIRENDASAATIDISFKGKAPAAGILAVKLESVSTYGVDYVTEPAAVGGMIFLHVNEGQSKASIKLTPVNNSTFKADRNINLQLLESSGGVIIGMKDSFWCTITEDDGYQISTISSIRAKFNDDKVVIHGDVYVEGIVTSIDNLTSKRIVVEDGTGAIQIHLVKEHTLTRGDLVLVNLNYGILQELKGVLEVFQVSNFEKLGQDALRSNKLTLEELFQIGSQLQSQTIQLTGVSFIDANGSSTMFGDRIVTDGIRVLIVRTNSTASFKDEVLPEGPISVTGIFTSVGGKYYLYPQEFDDIRGFIAGIRRRF